MPQSPRYHVRPSAADDIVAIFQTIDQNQPTAADRFVAELDRTFELLATMPRLGTVRRVSGRLKGLRSWPLTSVGPYVIFYIPRSDGIDVIRIIHGARDVDRKLRKA
jgi:toxin ParE1/3/4